MTDINDVTSDPIYLAMRDQRDKARAEAERLHEQIEREADFTVTGDELDRCLDRAEKAEAKVERLREALTDVLNHWVLSDAPEEAVINRAVELLDAVADSPPSAITERDT